MKFCSIYVRTLRGNWLLWQRPWSIAGSWTGDYRDLQSAQCV